MKHYENGMFGQSLAYQDKIVACAQEAGVDFDIVRVIEFIFSSLFLFINTRHVWCLICFSMPLI